MPSKRKKSEARKAKKRGEERKRKVTFKPKNYLEILLSVHARTLQANIVHLDQKAVKCMTSKQLCCKF